MTPRLAPVAGARGRGGYVPLAATALGAGVLALALSARLGGTTDSIQYLFAARSLLDGEGLRGVDGAPFIQYAPLLPLVVAALSSVGIDLLVAARIVAVISLSASTLVAGLWTRRITGQASSAACGGAVAVLILPALLTRFVWAESLFISVSLAAGFMVTVALQRASHGFMLAGGAFTGLAATTRRAGLPLLAITLYIAWAWPDSGRSRAKASLAFGLPSCLIAGAALLRNAIVAESSLPATPDPGRSLAEVLGEASSGISAWFAPPGSPWVVRLAVTLAVAGALVWAIAVLRRRQLPRIWWAAACVPFAFGFIYMITNVLSALSTSIGSLTDRMLTPCYPLFVVGAFSIIWTAVSEWAVDTPPAVRRRLLLGSAVFPPLVVWVAAVGGIVRYGVELQPRERLGPSVADSEVLRAAAALPFGTLLSNSHVNAAWVTRRPVVGAPSDADALTRLDSFVATSATYLIWVESEDAEGLTLDELAESCSMEPVGAFSDGQILRIERCIARR